jgi:hypothetical protein
LASEVLHDGRLRSWPASCRRGDHVELLALRDVIVVLNPCPDDLYGSSQYEPRAIRVLSADDAASASPALLALTPAFDLGARSQLTVALPEQLRDPLEAVRADGWLGDQRAAVVRALLFRWWERSLTPAPARPAGSARSPDGTTAARTAPRVPARAAARGR